MATGRLFKGMGWPARAAGEKGKTGVSAPSPAPTQERGGSPPSGRVGGSALCVSGCERDRRQSVCVCGPPLSLCISQKQTPPGTVLVSPLPASFSHVSPCPPEAPILQSTVIVLLGPASHQGPADPSETRWAPLWSGIAFEAAPLALPRGQPGGASSHPFLRDVSRRDVGLMA